MGTTPVLPTFLVIGAMKCGTTSLARYLGQHPDVFVPVRKEPGFFNPEGTWWRGVEWYSSLFEPGSARAARGEASTSYTKAPRIDGVAPLVHRTVPDVRLVYLVRDPVERVHSHLVHETDHGTERRPPEQAVKEEPDYLDFSRFALQLERYLEHFSPEQILVLSNDDLRDRRAEALDRAFRHIGVDPTAALVDTDTEHNRGEAKRGRMWGPVHSVKRAVDASGVGRLVPAGARRWARSRLASPVPAFSAELDRWIRDELAEDQSRLDELLPTLGPPDS
jgi:Sulfotransferase domain